LKNRPIQLFLFLSIYSYGSVRASPAAVAKLLLLLLRNTLRIIAPKARSTLNDGRTDDGDRLGHARAAAEAAFRASIHHASLPKRAGADHDGQEPG
jgi:hypothetical protein